MIIYVSGFYETDFKEFKEQKCPIVEDFVFFDNETEDEFIIYLDDCSIDYECENGYFDERIKCSNRIYREALEDYEYINITILKEILRNSCLSNVLSSVPQGTVIHINRCEIIINDEVWDLVKDIHINDIYID